jgi:uncharacterized OB-fold protein
MTQKTNMGWECPKCGRCYSPFTEKCSHCPETNTLVSSGTIQTNTATMMAHPFERDGTSNICKKCGLEDWRHPIVTYTTNNI